MEKAEKLYLVLLETKATDQQNAIDNHQLAVIKDRQGRAAEAVDYYEKAIKIQERTCSNDDDDLATSFNNEGTPYFKMKSHSGEYAKARKYFQTVLDIRTEELPAGHHDPRLNQDWTELCPMV